MHMKRETKMVKLLLGDDSASARDTLHDYLFYCEDINVETFESGEALVERARDGTKDYNWIMTDFDYEENGKLNGIDVVREIRKFDPETPIYLHTGEVMAQEKYGTEPGLTRIINKSEGIEKIVEILKG